MLSIDRLLNGWVLITPLVLGALITGVMFIDAQGGAQLPLSPFQIALVVSILLLISKKLIHGDIHLQVYGLEFYYILFLALIFFSIIYTPDREEALFYSFRFATLLGMTYIIYNAVETYEQLKKVVMVMVIAGIGLALFSFWQFYMRPEIAAFNYANQGGKLLRSSSEALDPNIFASNFFVPLMLLIGYFSVCQSWLKRLGYFSLIVLVIGSVLLTYSRSSWVSIAMGTLVIIYFTGNYRILIYLGISFLIALGASETVQQLTQSFLERLMDIFSGTPDDSTKFRVVLAVTALYMILDSYFLGVGFQGFSTVFKTYHPPETTQGIFEPHNQFYAVFAELGLFGFMLFLAIVYQILKTAWKSVQISQLEGEERILSVALLASLICYLVFYNFLGGMFYNSVLFILIGLIFVNHKLLEQKEEQPAHAG